MHPITTGITSELTIQKVFPRTRCFVQVDLSTLSIRWTDEHAITLAAVKTVQFDVHRSITRLTSRRVFLAGALNPRRWRQSWKAQVRQKEEKLAAVLASARKRRSSEADHRTPQVAIRFIDRGGVERVLYLRTSLAIAKQWVTGLPELLKMIPHIASPAHWHWALSCMTATSQSGASGFLRRDHLPSLLRRANHSALPATALDEILAAVKENENHWKLPHWLRAAINSNGHGEALLSTLQITSLLVRLLTSSKGITDLFECYATDGRMDLKSWLTFFRKEQGEAFTAQGESLGSMVVMEGNFDVQLREGQQQFEQAFGSGPANEGGALSPQQFALLLLSRQNDAAAAAQGLNEESELTKPLTHYWQAPIMPHKVVCIYVYVYVYVTCCEWMGSHTGTVAHTDSGI